MGDPTLLVASSRPTPDPTASAAVVRTRRRWIARCSGVALGGRTVDVSQWSSCHRKKPQLPLSRPTEQQKNFRPWLFCSSGNHVEARRSSAPTRCTLCRSSRSTHACASTQRTVALRTVLSTQGRPCPSHMGSAALATALPKSTPLPGTTSAALSPSPPPLRAASMAASTVLSNTSGLICEVSPTTRRGLRLLRAAHSSCRTRFRAAARPGFFLLFHFLWRRLSRTKLARSF